MTTPTCVLDGFGPMPLVRPGSAADVGDMVRKAAADGTALYPVGGQTMTGIGNLPTKPGVAVDMRGLAQVIDFPARDMTITVQAGISVRDLRDTLAQEKLRLPIDVPQADHATLGGILAANVSGPRRLGYGTLRDYVIGISAVNDEGNEFKSGGRVVKNVAGYDLCKLLVGSLGTLGIIAQVTLKLRPLAEQHALVTFPSEPADLDSLLTRIHDSRTRPVCVELLNSTAAQIAYAQAELTAPDAPWIVVVGYEGNPDAVTWQLQQLIKELAPQTRVAARVDFTAGPLWNGLVDLACWPLAQTAIKANMLPSAVAEFCRCADAEPNRPALRAHAASGIVHGQWPVALTLEGAAHMLTAWRERARAGQGSAIVTACPSAWKGTLDVWGPPTTSLWLSRDIKARFDPRRIFNPGRFIGGI